MARAKIQFDLQISYRAIRNWARDRDIIPIDWLAELNGHPEWTSTVSKRARAHLDELGAHATRHGWPMPGAVVLPKTGSFGMGAMRELAESAKRCGVPAAADPMDFFIEQEEAMSVWAQVAPDHLGFSGPASADADAARAADPYDLQVSYPAIREAARRRECITYALLAERNGDAVWSDAAQRRVSLHLEHLVAHARRHGWPMPSAVVLPDASGPCGGSLVQCFRDDEDDGPAGDYPALGISKRDYLLRFMQSAGDYAMPGVKPAEFLRKQQIAMFAWAQIAPDHLGFPARM